ncbi:MAG: flavocytochrome c, partial [Clostridia bacterium]|nr:flavocytochrome c [Clostridia bacterium]
TAETLDCDVVIVGAGGAGLTAAVRATQAGAKVLVLEKMPFVGGNSLKASGGMNCADTKFQAALDITDSGVPQFIEDTMNGGHGINDLALVTTMAENSAEAVDWLESIGAPLPKVAATGGTVHKYLHSPEDGSPVGEYLVAKLDEEAKKNGIEVMLNTTATEILMDGGAAVGVKANDAAHEYTINAKAVVLATGGFGANFDLMCSFNPSLANAVTTNHPGATGDGILMAEAVGAATVDMDQIQLHPTVYQATSMLVSEKMRSLGAILVNQDGVRFTNDLATRDAVSNAELEQPGGYAWIIFDQNLVDNNKSAAKYIEQGMAVTGETYEALAEAMNVDAEAFVKTMETWNAAVASGEDAEFGRNNGMDADLSTAPFFAIQIAPGIHHTMGGVKIDTATRVIDTEGQPIPGLFAAGETTGGVHGGNRIGGNAVCDFVVFGRIAGANAAEYAGAEEVAPAA